MTRSAGRGDGQEARPRRGGEDRHPADRRRRSPTEILSCVRADPDFTIFHGYVLAPLPEFMNQAKQLGLKTKFMGTFWSMDNSIWAKVGDAADGFMGVMP